MGESHGESEFYYVLTTDGLLAIFDSPLIQRLDPEIVGYAMMIAEKEGKGVRDVIEEALVLEAHEIGVLPD